VVNISSSKVVKSPQFSEPELRQFFENGFGQVPREIREHGLGSGVITRSDGYILTSSHVVEGSDAIKISMSDGREFDGKVVGFDTASDLGVVKINVKYLPTADFGAPDPVRVGEFTLAIGDPFGVGQTVTMGIVSATGRSGLGIEDVENFIQTDAAINPGNSGGALVNVKGNLIGINTAIVGRRSGAQGLGFAVPVTMARNIMDQIIATGKVAHGWLGVAVQPVTRDIATVFNLPGEVRGALIADVEPDSPAAKAGLRKGDILLSLDDTNLADAPQFKLKMSQMKPGTTLKLRMFRDGKDMQQAVVLAEAPLGDASERSSTVTAQPAVKPDLGISVEPLTDAIKDQLKLPSNTSGVVVTEVDPAGTAAEAGLQHGDVIEELNRKPVSNADELQQSVASTPKKPVLLLVVRAGSHVFLTTPPLAPVVGR
jgi:serine protease Do